LLVVVAAVAQVTTVAEVAVQVVCYITQVFLLVLDPTQLQLVTVAHKTLEDKIQLDLVTPLLEVAIG
jgi:hypothetical protein